MATKDVYFHFDTRRGEGVMTFRASTFGCALIVASLIAIESPALAQDRRAENAAQAEALFREARSAMEAQDFIVAKEKLQASYRLAPGAGTLLNLGICHERLGFPADAYLAYRDAAALAHKQRQAERVALANARLAAIRRSVALVDVALTKPGTTTSIDGVVVEGVVPLEEGRHVLRATAPGRVPWTREVTARIGERVVVLVPELDPDPGSSPKVATAPASAPAPAPATSPAAASDKPGTGTGGDARRLIGLGVAGAGVAAIGVGLVFGLGAKSAYDQTSEHCNDRICDAEGVDLTRRAKTSATWATFTTAVGAGIAATGLVLYFTAPKTRSTAHVAASAAPDGVRINIGKKF